MLKIYLTRHGQNQDNADGILNGHRDESLTTLGLDQAKMTADYIREAKIDFDKIYTSPLLRASQTAKVIANELGVNEPEIIPELIERDFGSMTGKYVSDIKALCQPDIIETDTVTYFLAPDGAETFSDLVRRGEVVIELIKEKHPSGSVLLVTHGDIGKMMYAAYYDLDWRDVLINFHFGNCELLLLSEDSPASEVHVFKQNQHNH
ncbi:histidine phosphatase family protein [Candidatus Kaiserbacteria bacterium]|nr:histidine phosphatase family protein [Candidatus Kaiserbacteria bacterium]